MSKKLFIANWKMGIEKTQIHRFVKDFFNSNTRMAAVAVAAPFVYLGGLKSKKFDLAAQDVSMYEPGAYTGDTSAEMLKEFGVKYSLVGHSERRIYFKESDLETNKKINRLLANKITPVLCVGETATERKSGKTKQVLTRQLKIGLKGVDVSKVIVAYELVWAISTFQKTAKKISATDSDILEAHRFIRQQLISISGQKGKLVPILYGGSVNPENSKSFLNFKEVNGVLVGAASRSAKDFSAIIRNLK